MWGPSNHSSSYILSPLKARNQQEPCPHRTRGALTVSGYWPTTKPLQAGERLPQLLKSHGPRVNLFSGSAGASGGPTDSGVLWQIPAGLHSARAQSPLEDVRNRTSQPPESDQITALLWKPAGEPFICFSCCSVYSTCVILYCFINFLLPETIM